jgi:peroxiredoxin
VQLVELQEAWRRLQANGVAIFAISYDSVEVLAAFADKRGITYPLLSDQGSHTIRALGLLNEQHLVEQHAFYGIPTRDEQRGVAYPGTFVLDEWGIISEKHFEQSYRVRPTARIFEEFALGMSEATPPPADAPRANGEKLEVRVRADAPTYRPYQQVRLHVDLSLSSGLHVFTSPVPDGFTPLRLEVEPLDGLEVGQPTLPAARPFTLAGLDEDFVVYEDSIRAMIPLRFARNLGATVITMRIEYQACTLTECFPPATLRVDVPLNGLDLIRD